MTKFSTLMIAATLTLAVSACGSYRSIDCDYYPREHYEDWQERCGVGAGSADSTRERRVIRSFNESLEK